MVIGILLSVMLLYLIIGLVVYGYSDYDTPEECKFNWSGVYIVIGWPFAVVFLAYYDAIIPVMRRIYDFGIRIYEQLHKND